MPNSVKDRPTTASYLSYTPLTIDEHLDSTVHDYVVYVLTPYVTTVNFIQDRIAISGSQKLIR